MSDYYCRCKDCKHTDPSERSSYKWYCTWYRSYEDPDKVRECRHYESQNGGSTCFLTSACCRHRGLPDNCAELMALRNFRDGVLMQTQEGRHLVEEYERIAPQIVSRIEASAEKDSIYEEIYAAICRIRTMIDGGAYEEAVEHYRAMVLHCREQLGVD